MELKAKKRTIISVDYGDLEAFIRKEYGQSFEFISDQECPNDISLEFGVSGEGIDEYGERELKEFRESGEHSFLVQTILDDLCRQRKIEAGDYLVHVSW